MRFFIVALLTAVSFVAATPIDLESRYGWNDYVRITDLIDLTLRLKSSLAQRKAINHLEEEVSSVLV
jgi:hypothetical protein